MGSPLVSKSFGKLRQNLFRINILRILVAVVTDMNCIEYIKPARALAHKRT